MCFEMAATWTICGTARAICLGQPSAIVMRMPYMTKRSFPDDFIPAAPREDTGTLTTSEIVAMAWDDDTSFDDIKFQSGLSEPEVIKIMQSHMKPSSFRMWRKRVSGRASKHKTRVPR